VRYHTVRYGTVPYRTLQYGTYLPYLPNDGYLPYLLRIEVQEGRANLKCPQCSEQLHPNDVEVLVGGDTNLLQLYQFLMVRRVLAADPDTRSIVMILCYLQPIRAYSARLVG